MLIPFVLTLVVVLSVMTGLWLLSLRWQDASIVDIFWGAGFVVVATIAALVGAGPTNRRVLVWVLTATWGLRLARYLFQRNWGHGEDYRYVAMRRQWGARFWWVSLFQVFWLQAVVLWIVSLPVQVDEAGFPRRPRGERVGCGSCVGFYSSRRCWSGACVRPRSSKGNSHQPA